MVVAYLLNKILKLKNYLLAYAKLGGGGGGISKPQFFE
jgi:hypothetical protein